MVDGADKIKGISHNVYNNQPDAVTVEPKSTYEPLPIVENKTIYKHPFAVETENKDLIFETPKNAPQKAKDFIAALTRNKQALMKELNIDSETYDMLAQTAVAIADTETDFGCFMNRVYKAYRELYVRYERFVKSSNQKTMHYSRGITNLKYTLHTEDNFDIKNKMIKFGIYNEYQLENTEKSAIGTIILLSELNKRIDRSCLEGFEQSQEKYGTTRIDALCALWNGGRSKALKNGSFNPKEWEYTKQVHKSLEDYKLIKE